MKIDVSHVLAILILATPAMALPATVDATAPAPFTGGAMDVTELSIIAGRADTAMEIRANNTSNVSNNSVVGESQTGAINFDAAAFQGMAGLSLLSANTGNNVSINSSLNVNVSIQPQ